MSSNAFVVTLYKEGHDNDTATTKWKTTFQKQRPLTLPSPARGEGKTRHDNDNGKSFISFWIATGGQRRPRNDDPSENDTATTKM
jgi:hypothetical protein